MDKNRILEMSRRDNEKKDPYELEIKNKALNASRIAMAGVLFVIYSVKMFVKGEKDNEFWSAIAICLAVQFIYMGIKLKDKTKLTIGIVYGVIFAVSLVLCIKEILM